MPFFVFAFVLLFFTGCEKNGDEPSAMPPQKTFTYENYAREIKPEFEKFNNIESYYTIFPPARDYYGFTDAQVRQIRKEKFNQSLDKLYYLDPNARSIPHITHRIWVTSAKNPHEAPAFGVQNYIDSIKLLKGKGNYKHYFWCLDKSKIPQTIKALKKSEVGNLITVREIREVFYLFKCQKYVNFLMKNKYLVAYTDYVRMNLVYLFGGIYTDFTWKIIQDITLLLNNYQYLMRIYYMSSELTILDKNLFAAPKGDLLIGRWLDIASNLGKLPKHIKDMTPKLREQLEWILCGYTNILPALMEDNALFMPITSTIVEKYHLESWRKESPKFGNNSPEESNQSLYDIA